MKTKPTEALKIIDENWDKGGTLNNLKIADMIACNVAFKEGQSSPKIKKLEWKEDDLFTGIIVSEGFSLQFYEIKIIDNTLYIGDTEQSFRTIDEAKAAAQADFEKRIKECLD